MMFKTKIKKYHVVAAVLSVAMAAAVTSGATLLSASAEGEIFSTGGLDGRVYITGTTKESVATAFENEAQRIKAEMEKAGAGDQFSVVNAPLTNGWPDANHIYFVSAHMNFGAYRTSNLWQAGYGFIVYNPHDDAAYTINGGAATAFANANNGWANQIIHAGYPKGNEFAIGDDIYQNFTLGYSKNAEFVYGKSIDAQGIESPLTADEIAESMFVPVYSDFAVSSRLDGLSVVDYETAYKAYYEDEAVNTGMITVYANRNNSLWRQDVNDEEGTKLGEVVYNSKTKEMFTVTNTFLSAYDSTTAWGNPVEEEKTVGAQISQQYDNGVVVYNEGEDLAFYEASHVDENGDVVSDMGANAIGKMTDQVVALLPAGVTAAAVEAAAKAVYVESMGTPVDYMTFFEGTNVLEQRIVTEAGAVTYIYVNTEATELAGAVLEMETYETYKLPTVYNEGNKQYDVTGEMILGPAIGNKFTATDDNVYQNFLFGAIKFGAENEVLPGVNYSADGARTVLDLSEYIVIDAASIIIPDRYDIGAADLLAKFRAAYKKYVEAGVALGMPNKEGIGSWSATGNYESTGNEFEGNQGMIKLGLHAADSNAICYYGVTAMLAYSPVDGEVYLMKDSVISNMATYYSYYGAPISDLTETTLTTEEGDEVTVYIQNFELGYLTVMGTSASMTGEKHWHFEWLGAVNLDGSEIPGNTYPGKNNGGSNGNENSGSTNNGGTSASGSSSNEENVGCFSTVAFGTMPFALLLGSVVVCLKKKKNE